MKILKIELLSADLAATEEFYTNHLGFSCSERTENSITLKAGYSRIIFVKKDEIHPVYHFAFNIPHNQIKEALNWLRERVDVIQTEDKKEIVDFDNWNAKAFYFLDNNGNILEFLARFDLPNESQEQFSSASIIGLSEMAIVVDKVKEYADRLRTENKLPFFSRQPPLPNFTVLGDDNGLIIISETHRHWYPTEIICEKYYVRIDFILDGVSQTIVVNEHL